MLRVAVLALVALASTPFSCRPQHETAVPQASGHYRVTSPGPYDDYPGGPAIGQPSPDGKWSVAYHDYTIVVTDRATHRVRRYSTVQHGVTTCCTEISWLPPHLLIFDDNYRVLVWDPATRHVKKISDASNFVISPDGRWAATFSDAPHDPDIIAIVRTSGGTCLLVPRHRNDDDTPVAFTDNGVLLVSRSKFDGWEHTGATGRLLRFPLRTLKTTRCH